MILGSFITLAAFSTGCAVRAGYYDPYYHDHHSWAEEQPYYNRVGQETHRQHEDFNHRSKQEQQQYWEWRHHQH